jgi:hypothetical protein
MDAMQLMSVEDLDQRKPLGAVVIGLKDDEGIEYTPTN